MTSLFTICVIFDVLYYAVVRYFDMTALDEVDNSQVMLLQNIGYFVVLVQVILLYNYWIFIEH